MNNTKSEPGSLSDKKQIPNQTISAKSIAPQPSENRTLSFTQPMVSWTSESCPNKSDSEEGGYQPLIPPRRLNANNQYQSLTPTQEHTEFQSESVGEGDLDKESKNSYQSLIQADQPDGVSSYYQSLTNFTQNQPEYPASSSSTSP